LLSIFGWKAHSAVAPRWIHADSESTLNKAPS
jgi:hypothetical protein